MLVPGIQPKIRHPSGGDTQLVATGRKVNLKAQYRGGRLDRLLCAYQSDDVILTSLITSVSFSTVGMLVVVYGLPELSDGVWWSWMILLLSCIGAALTLFVIYAHDQHPMPLEIGDSKAFKVFRDSIFIFPTTE